MKKLKKTAPKKSADKSVDRMKAQIASLQAELDDAKETLRAIQSGEVDALVVRREGEEQVFTLHGAEHPYRVVIETMNEGMATLSNDGTVLYCNSRFAEILGENSGKIIGQTMNRFISGSQLAQFELMLERSREQTVRGEFLMRSADGRDVPVYSSLAAIKDPAAGICMVVTDIGELKKTQKALMETNETLERRVVERTEALRKSEEDLQISNEELAAINEELLTSNDELRATHEELLRNEERFRSVLDDSRDVIYRLNLQTGSYEYISPSSGIVVGFSPDELKAQNAKGSQTMIHPDDIPAMRAALARLEETGKEDVEYRQMAKSGEYRWLSNHMSMIRDDAGRPLYRDGNIRDITARKLAEEKLRDSERLYRAIGESIDYGIWICDAQGRNTYASESFLKLVGITQEQCSGFNWGNVLHPDDRETTIAAWKQCVQGGAPWYREHRYRGTDGQWHPILACGVAVRNERGEVTAWAGINLDISRLKQTEMALRESEERLRLAQDSAAVGIWDWKVEAGALDFTPELNKLYGLPRGAIKTYQDWRELVHPNDIVRIEASRDEAIAKHEPFHMEFRARHSSGGYRWILTKGGAIYDEAGKTVRVLGVNIDITDRKQAEEALALAHRKIQDIIDNTTAIIYAFDLENRFVLANAAVAKLLNSTPAQIIGKCRQDFMPKADADWHEANDRKVIEAGRALDFEEKSELAGCSITWLTTKFPLRDAEGRIYAVGGISSDISERKRDEEKLKQLMEELKRSNTDLEQFASVANHDLREPLRTITSFLQLLEKRCKGSLDKDAMEFINFAVDGAGRMDKLLAGLLNYSRVHSQGKPMKPVSVQDSLNDAMLNLRKIIAESNAEIVSEPLPTLNADWMQLTQLFQNLIHNAIKFRSEQRLQIHITSKKEGNHFLFSVSDNGIGIEPQYHDHIFTIFRRVNSKDERSGHGVGLAVCKKIVERHGGKIWLESTPGKGSTFFFTIPC